ncbi:hypothetical protein VDGD_20780 [Verticillium dahliae]|nr:hypothetical protein VDGD_20780 [Verticillium dahliae]
MMRRPFELEKTEKEPNHLELFKGTDCYRTLIVCCVYAAQNLTGNLIANQAVYVFEQASMSTDTAFAMVYLWGSAFNVVLLVALGAAASFGKSTAASLAQASLGLIVSVLFTLGPAPASWVIIGETSAIRLRPLTTGIGRGCYYVANIPCILLASYMLNPKSGNLGGKCGYVWGGTGLFCLIMAYFYLPEMKGRSYREIDILFKRRVPARKWTKTAFDINDDQ